MLPDDNTNFCSFVEAIWVSREVVHEMMCSLCLVSPLCQRLVGIIQLDELRPECHRGVNNHLMLCVRDYKQTKSIIAPIRKL